jgi:hypothetical protein
MIYYDAFLHVIHGHLKLGADLFDLQVGLRPYGPDALGLS